MTIISSFFMLALIIGTALTGYFFFYKSKGIKRIKTLEKQKSTFSKEIKQPKIVIMGGSDVLFSFHTDHMAEALNQPVVNLGTNVGLGMGYLIDFAKENITTGDTVIACIAYSLYTNPPYHIFAFECYRMFSKKKLCYFTPKQLITYFFGNIKLNSEYIQRKFELSKSGSYINNYGTDFSEQKNKPLTFPKEFKRTKSIETLEAFKDYCHEMDIDFWVTFPSTLKFETYLHEDYLKQLEKYLSKNFQVIGHPADYYVDRPNIYNSVYHVNDSGQQLRTQAAIVELKQIMNGGK